MELISLENDICFLSVNKPLWSIQTELEWDQEWEWELNQYYVDPFTLQWELELTHIEIYCTRHHKFPCKVTM